MLTSKFAAAETKLEVVASRTKEYKLASAVVAPVILIVPPESFKFIKLKKACVDGVRL